MLQKTSVTPGPTCILLAQCHRGAGRREKPTKLDVSGFGRWKVKVWDGACPQAICYLVNTRMAKHFMVKIQFMSM